MHPLAQKTNDDLPASIMRMLSRRGRSAYFPAAGILGQSAEAKGATINATIGIALDDSGEPMHLPGLSDVVGVDPRDAFPYAPSYGKPALRAQWQAMMRVKNPSLAGVSISSPVVTNALTHALSVAGALFLDPDDVLIMPDRFWGNYRLIFEHGFDARIDTYPTFIDDGYNVDGLREKLLEGPIGKRVVILNFPNNPTGYTCTEAEGRAICQVLLEAAEAGHDVVALIDDAYFGLVYEDGIMKESIFAMLADAHPRLLAVKIDGATKEDFAWGYRVGFLTYGYGEATTTGLKALEDKTAGLVRGSISNASHVSQSMLLTAYQSDQYPDWKQQAFDVMFSRYQAVRTVFNDRPEYRNRFVPLPFNSGYFLCVRPIEPGITPEAIRRLLLERYDTGVIATGDAVRIAFSSTSAASIPLLFDHLASAIDLLAAERT